MLTDSSEPLELGRREQILLSLEAAVWGRGHFLCCIPICIHGLALPKQKGCRKCRITFLKKKKNHKHFYITAPCIWYLNFLFKKDLKPQCFKIKLEKKVGFLFICFSPCLLFNSWLLNYNKWYTLAQNVSLLFLVRVAVKIQKYKWLGVLCRFADSDLGSGANLINYVENFCAHRYQ